MMAWFPEKREAVTFTHNTAKQFNRPQRGIGAPFFRDVTAVSVDCFLFIFKQNAILIRSVQKFLNT